MPPRVLRSIEELKQKCAGGQTGAPRTKAGHHEGSAVSVLYGVVEGPNNFLDCDSVFRM